MNSKLDWARWAADNLAAVRAAQPLVHNITNFVAMNFTANVLLASGAAPVMAHAAEEVEEMVALAKTLVLNIGTLDAPWIAAMAKAGRKATVLGIPIILDPVGAGATQLRTETALRFLAEMRVAIVRGNASEILALGGAAGGTKGVESTAAVDAAAECAAALAQKTGMVVAITGPEDFITDGNRYMRVANGHPLMGSVTGMGCGATATIGAFAAVEGDPFSAAATALAYYGLAGERAAKSATGPGSFAVGFLDALHAMASADLAQGCRIREA